MPILMITDDNDSRYGAAQAPVCKTVYEEECQTVQESFLVSSSKLHVFFKLNFLFCAVS